MNASKFDSQFENDAAEAPQTMSLMGGIAGGDGATGEAEFGVTPDNENKKLATQSVLIFLIISVVAVGALLMMRQSSGGISALASSAETDAFMETVDIRLANLQRMDRGNPLHPHAMRAHFADTQQIIETIKADRTVKQVPIEQVRKNPFVLPSLVPRAPTANPAARAEAQRQERLNKLYGEVAAMTVTGVASGLRPAAWINGEMCQVGDVIGGLTVKSIDRRVVQFEASGLELRPDEAPFVLSISDD